MASLWARTRALPPAAIAAAAYAVLAAAVIGPGLLPGRTLVPVDILRSVQPYAGLGGGPAHNSLPSDSPFQFYPWFAFLVRSLRHGHIPTWNPHLLAGLPFTPNGF